MSPGAIGPNLPLHAPEHRKRMLRLVRTAFNAACFHLHFVFIPGPESSIIIRLPVVDMSSPWLNVDRILYLTLEALIALRCRRRVLLDVGRMEDKVRLPPLTCVIVNHRHPTTALLTSVLDYAEDVMPWGHHIHDRNEDDPQAVAPKVLTQIEDETGGFDPKEGLYGFAILCIILQHSGACSRYFGHPYHQLPG